MHFVATVAPLTKKARFLRKLCALTQGFVDQQKQNFEQYLADQYDIANAAKVETLEDGTILLVMSEGQDAIFDSIKDALSQ